MNLLSEFAWTDSGNAERLVAAHGSDLRFVRTWGRWLTWNEVFWSDDSGAVYRAAKATARAMLVEAAKINDDGRRRYATSWATRSESRSAIEAMVSLARHELAVAVAHERLDGDRMLLNCKNGTVDLRTGEMHAHLREDLCTKLAPVDFDASAACPTWDAFLFRVMGGNAEMVDYLQRLAGYALTGEIREHILAFFFGAGANGKSTFLRTLHAVLGDYASPAPRGLLFRARGGDRHPTELASLHGKRFVTCSEVEEGQTFDESLTKDLTGGDPIECRRMREDFWSFDPTHKLFVAGNHKPTVRGDDEGIWRRMRLVPWLVNLAENEQDKTLPDKLLAEAPGILAWCVRGCLSWQHNGLSEPSAVRAATTAYREENDSLGEFFRLHVIFEVTGTIARATLREAYEGHAKENGAQPLGAKRFTARLRERGVGETTVRVGTKVVQGWRGVRLATDAERVAAVAWAQRSDVVPCSGPIIDSKQITSRGALTDNQALQAATLLQGGEEGLAEWLEKQGIGGAG
ncbi:MAG TPA: phage/plasmid primase, P4 family [Polyangiaceae bacterium]|jgi:putative DNA primase/helicase|nr:phage/plasmid primase, P4 family [Polyangiaceae bacterium]